MAFTYDINTTFDAVGNFFKGGFEEGHKIASTVFTEANNVIADATGRTYTVISSAVGTLTKSFREIEGIRATSNAILSGIRGMEIAGIATEGFSKLLEIIRSVRDVITVVNPISRLSEILTGDAMWKYSEDGFPNLTRLASRIEYLICGTLISFNLLEKWSVIAEGVGNRLAMNIFGKPQADIVPIIGDSAAALDLADSLSIAWKEGLNWENGFMIGMGVVKILSFHASGSKEYGLIVLGVVSAATSSLIYAAKSIKAQYLS